MLDNVIGQERAKQILNLLTHGYHRRGIIPPVGVFGGTGLGKTHLVSEWCKHIGAEEIYINGTSVKDALAFRAYFAEARKNSSKHYIVFIDECHNLPKKVQDTMLSVLEDPAILCTTAPTDMGMTLCVDGNRFISKGDIMRESLPKNMTFVLATTDPVQLKDPILNRLRKITLAPYTLDDKIAIAMLHIGKQGLNISIETCEKLAKRARSIRHLKDDLCETYVDINSLYASNDDETLETLDDLLGIDADGANDQDRDYLDYLSVTGVVGLDTMAGRLCIDKQEILKTIEPFLLAHGWIIITGRGRALTEAGHKKVYDD